MLVGSHKALLSLSEYKCILSLHTTWSHAWLYTDKHLKCFTSFRKDKEAHLAFTRRPAGYFLRSLNVIPFVKFVIFQNQVCNFTDSETLGAICSFLYFSIVSWIYSSALIPGYENFYMKIACGIQEVALWWDFTFKPVFFFYAWFRAFEKLVATKNRGLFIFNPGNSTQIIYIFWEEGGYDRIV